MQRYKSKKLVSIIPFVILRSRVAHCGAVCRKNLSAKPTSKLSKLHVGIKHQIANKFKKNLNLKRKKNQTKLEAWKQLAMVRTEEAAHCKILPSTLSFTDAPKKKTTK
jgi:hypothetical protein